MTLPSRILSAEPFVPHTLEHLTAVRAFPSPFPPDAYAKLLKEYGELSDTGVWRIVYESDGLKVTGLMALPAAIQPKRHPLLIYNRGGSREYGKLTVYSALRSMVPFARQGYIVFASNYRGNDGGEGQEEFGGADVDDVLNLLDIGRAHEGYDGVNSFMIGHSRGGLMTLLAIKHGAALNAAVSIAGIADARPFSDADLMRENVFKPLIPGYEQAPERALTDRSPICWTDAITTPLLLLHGDHDKDVPVADSINLHKLLQQDGRVSDLVIYPTGNHALVRAWPDVLERCGGWMERYRI